MLVGLVYVAWDFGGAPERDGSSLERSEESARERREATERERAKSKHRCVRNAHSIYCPLYLFFYDGGNKSLQMYWLKTTDS